MKSNRMYQVIRMVSILCAATSMLMVTGMKVYERWMERQVIAMAEEAIGRSIDPEEWQQVQEDTGGAAGAIGIIGGADGPTAIFTTTQTAPWTLAAPAVLAGLSVAGLAALLVLKKRGSND